MTRSLVHVTQVAPYLDGPAGVHGVLRQSNVALGEIADLAGLRFVPVEDVRDLRPDDLADAAVVSLFTIGETPWDEPQRAALLDGLRSGRTGVLAIHAATDSCHGWDEYLNLVGARFNGHPWTQEVDLEICERAHPAYRHLTSPWHWHDEIYQFRGLRPDARILLRVNDAELDLGAKGADRPSYGFPLSWCYTEGRGRVFSTSLGHFPYAWEQPPYLRHLAGGLAWVLGEGE